MRTLLIPTEADAIHAKQGQTPSATLPQKPTVRRVWTKARRKHDESTMGPKVARARISANFPIDMKKATGKQTCIRNFVPERVYGKTWAVTDSAHVCTRLCDRQCTVPFIPRDGKLCPERTVWSRGGMNAETALDRLCEQRPFVVQIGTVEIRELDQGVIVVKRHASPLKRQKAFFAQFAEHAIDVDRT